MLTLRPYQTKAISDCYSWMAHNNGSPLIVLPTGSGKSLVIAKIVEDVLTNWPDQRLMILTHVRELVSQDYAELMGLIPKAPAGIYSAGLNRRDDDAQILFASIQSIHKKAYSLRDQRCHLIIIDEAHLLGRNQDSMYHKFIADMRKINQADLRVVGLSATPFRLDSGWLHKGDGAMFDDIAHETNMINLINDGYLSKLISKRTKVQLNTAGVGIRDGEFIAGELEKAVDLDDVNRSAVEEIVKYGDDRKGWIIFGTGLSHCAHLRDAIREYGYSAECVFGTTDKKERDLIIRKFKAREIRCLVSMNVLTTGFNAKHLDLIGMLRPTKSAALFVQMVGRGCRPSPETNKEDCLILDFSGNTAYFGPVDKVQPREKKKGTGEAPVKKCPSCEEMLHASLSECPWCGYQFPPSEVKVEAKASTAPIVSTEEKLIEWIAVDKVFYTEHPGRDGKPPTMRVVYQCGTKQYSEFLCLEHLGYPRQKAAMWWATNGGGMPPLSVKEAVSRARARDELKKPVKIAVKAAGKWFEVMKAEFE